MHPQQPQQYAPASPPPMAEQPLAVINPIQITPGVIKWVVGMIASVIMFLAASPVAERYLNPAKQSDLEAISILVKVLQEGQTVMKTAQNEQRVALERLTLAVDNLSGIVDGLKVPTQAAVRAVAPSRRR